MVRETRLCIDDLILPLFVSDADGVSEIASMPGTFRRSVDESAKVCGATFRTSEFDPSFCSGFLIEKILGAAKASPLTAWCKEPRERYALGARTWS